MCVTGFKALTAVSEEIAQLETKEFWRLQDKVSDLVCSGTRSRTRPCLGRSMRLGLRILALLIKRHGPLPVPTFMSVVDIGTQIETSP